MDERRHNMDGALFVDDEPSDREPSERRPRSRSHASVDDGKADDARRITQGILDRMDLEARVHVREDDEQVVLDIDGPDAGRAIGKKGMTLEALQFLVNKIVNREPDERRHIVLDSGDYRERHDNGLVSMAKREAKRAVSSGRAVTLEPMSARDRRVIHVSLAKFPGISTRSEGEGMERRLQIIPARGDRAERPARDDRSGRERRGRAEGRAHEPRGEARAPREERRDDRGGDRPRELRDDRASDRPRELRDDRGSDRPRELRDDRASDRPRELRDDRGSDRSRELRDDRASDRPRELRDDRGGDRPRELRDDRERSRDAERPREAERPRDDRAALVERARDDRARSTRDDRDRPRREDAPRDVDDRFGRGRR